ncbi:dTMP kinase [Rhabdothermincola salaria]|uniref:dTMP kinase n=1 Tax=Rhabdothermincola salaria TaxID=2903142 RepID=UPI001E3D86A4|nr:dTMP kinase [Rhabdothermincola salaria]
MTAPVEGRFIAFEGGEACGKSTQARLLADALGAVLTREPGGTAIGAQLRALMLSPDTHALDDRAEALLMAADRAQHVAEVVRPALAAGRHVVTDRYAGSSVAYQGYGRGLPPDEVQSLSQWATAGCWPDLVVVLVVPPSVSVLRLGGEHDRMEAAGDEFHARVLDGFLRQAEARPDRWVVLDGDRPVDEVHHAVRAVVRERLQLLP